MSAKPSQASFARMFVAELAHDQEAVADLRQLLDELAPPSGGRRLITANEAARALGLHPKTVTQAARDGRIPGATRVGNRLWRFDPEVLEVLPVVHESLGPAGPGRPARRPSNTSAAANAIRGAAA